MTGERFIENPIFHCGCVTCSLYSKTKPCIAITTTTLQWSLPIVSKQGRSRVVQVISRIHSNDLKPQRMQENCILKALNFT